MQAAAVPAEAVAHVYELEMVTRHSQLPAAGDAQLPVDIDLPILGAPEPRLAQHDQ